jgi:2-oxoglutarate ferredoxin oxidoreductase subunit alpha
MDAATQERMVDRIVNKIRKNADKIIRYELWEAKDAEVLVAAYGISARASRRAVREAREQGLKAGLLKLNTVWPFPEKLIRELSGSVKAMIMPEINYGQMVLELERCAGGKCAVKLLPHAGGSIHSPRTILAAISAAVKEG